MSAYWNFVTQMVPATLAKAEDVNTNLSGINTGFNLVEAEINKCLQVTNGPGVVDIGLNAAARANKLITFDVNGDIAVSTIMGDWKGDHADAAGTDYEIRDIVKDAAGSLGQDNLYICTTTHTSTGDLATDTANWELLVEVSGVAASAAAALVSENNAATSADFLDDRMLGAFTTAAEPTLDNDGNALLTGAQYFNTDLNRMKVYNGSSWQLTTANAIDVVNVPAGDIAATNVQAAIDELDTEKVSIAGEETITGAKVFSGAVATTGILSASDILMSKTLVQKIGSDVASATTLVLGNGNLFDITGTTAITAIGTRAAGVRVTLQFDGILTLTHHATNLILPGAANITTAAGDIGVFYEYATGDWRCVSYTRANVSPIQNFRGALVTDATQSISYSADEAIAFSSETYDTDSIHDNATNNTRLTVPSGVTKVKLKCYTVFATNGTGIRRLRIDKNGSPLSYGGVTGIENSPSASNVSVVSAFTAVLEVTPGDYFEATAFQEETGAGALNATGSWFSMEIIE